MKKAFFLCLCVLFFNSFRNATAQIPRDSVDVYVLTTTPGIELYATFGHSALRVVNYTVGYDVVYNWGLFDFSTPNFYIKFASGKLMYFLGISEYSNFLQEYREGGQGVYEQRLNLTKHEKGLILQNLANNYRDENRFYRYDFFYDNCATRIRDILEKSVDGKIVFDTSYTKQNTSLRNLLEQRLKTSPWISFGLSMMMGKAADSIASMRDYMFLPEHLKNLFGSARIVSGDSTRILTFPAKELAPPTLLYQQTPLYSSPIAVCWLLFIIVLIISIWEHKKDRNFLMLDVFFFLITALVGLLMLWLWNSSLHTSLHRNLNIVWLNPLNLIIVITLNRIKKSKWLNYLVWVYLTELILLIPFSFFVAQEIPSPGYPLIGIMLVRSIRLVKL